MRVVLCRLPVYTTPELKAFEHEVRTRTNGDSIQRTLAYGDFRLSILKFQQTGHPVCFKTVLPNYHFIAVESGVATLYRNVGTELDSEDPEISNQPPAKRARSH